MTARLRLIIGYTLLVVVPLLGLVVVLAYGSTTSPLAPATAVARATQSGGPLAQSNLSLSVLLLQVIVIIIASRLLGWLLRRLGQPQVIGEMLAGILLGRSLLGWIAPTAYDALFPTGSLRFLNALSQVGILLFIFLVGLELDPRVLRERGHTALLAGHASIAAPMFLGGALALTLFARLSPPGVPFVAFALFFGVAMSVTAFPVLARILAERGLQQTRLGALAVACAAVGDVTAWCVLAVVVAIARAGDTRTPLWLTIGGALAFVVVMLTVGRAILRRAHDRLVSGGASFQTVVAAAIVLILGAAWLTEWIGVHALFGAFIVGVAMPKDKRFVGALTDRFEDVMVTLLLPLFFAYTGLRMSVGLLSGGDLWSICLAVVAVAVVGKVAGTAMASRVSGLGWRDSLRLGALMNTRGLMELIILNIGLDLGVISPTLFTMMVLMAVTTTLMTSPALTLLAPAEA